MTPAEATERNYRVEHVTQYKYSEDVSVSYGRAHLLPRSALGQTVLASDLELDPGADELRSHVDYFGNTSTYYTVRRAHRALRIAATSEVRVRRSVPERAALDELTWEQVASLAAEDVAVREFVLPSPLVRATASVSDFTAASFTSGRALGAALVDLVERIHSEFSYVSGSTTVRTTLGEVMHRKQGVCQDFAQLVVGCLRSVGLPARYVSGYIETDPPPGQAKLQGVDASHAWAALGVPGVPGMDWVHIDPTNNQFVDGRYVVAGWGRDYSDVPPLKGVILTHAAKSTMSVHVDVTRVA
jgi:transglutaminase-like putative cysteine protease